MKALGELLWAALSELLAVAPRKILGELLGSS